MGIWKKHEIQVWILFLLVTCKPFSIKTPKCSLVLNQVFVYSPRFSSRQPLTPIISLSYLKSTLFLVSRPSFLHQAAIAGLPQTAKLRDRNSYYITHANVFHETSSPVLIAMRRVSELNVQKKSISCLISISCGSGYRKSISSFSRAPSTPTKTFKKISDKYTFSLL